MSCNQVGITFWLVRMTDVSSGLTWTFRLNLIKPCVITDKESELWHTTNAIRSLPLDRMIVLPSFRTEWFTSTYFLFYISKFVFLY